MQKNVAFRSPLRPAGAPAASPLSPPPRRAPAPALAPHVLPGPPPAPPAPGAKRKQSRVRGGRRLPRRNPSAPRLTLNFSNFAALPPRHRGAGGDRALRPGASWSRAVVAVPAPRGGPGGSPGPAVPPAPARARREPGAHSRPGAPRAPHGGLPGGGELPASVRSAAGSAFRPTAPPRAWCGAERGRASPRTGRNKSAAVCHPRPRAAGAPRNLSELKASPAPAQHKAFSSARPPASSVTPPGLWTRASERRSPGRGRAAAARG